MLLDKSNGQIDGTDQLYLPPAMRHLPGAFFCAGNNPLFVFSRPNGYYTDDQILPFAIDFPFCF